MFPNPNSLSLLSLQRSSGITSAAGTRPAGVPGALLLRPKSMPRFEFLRFLIGANLGGGIFCKSGLAEVVEEEEVHFLFASALLLK